MLRGHPCASACLFAFDTRGGKSMGGDFNDLCKGNSCSFIVFLILILLLLGGFAR